MQVSPYNSGDRVSSGGGVFVNLEQAPKLQQAIIPFPVHDPDKFIHAVLSGSGEVIFV